MGHTARDLSDDRWKVLGPLIPKPKRRRASMEEQPIGVERHSVGAAHRRSLGRSSRGVPIIPNLPPSLSAMGALWRDEGNPGGTCFRAEAQTCYRRARGFHRRDLCAGEKGGLKVGKTKRGKGTKIMAVADRHGLPVPICIESATPHEVKLATSTLVQMVVHDAPRNLIGDNPYDSDKLDDELRCCPHRSNRRIKTQDKRRLRRYGRRWKIERLFAWLQNFRRLVVRYERHAENILGMLHLACCLILLRHLKDEFYSVFHFVSYSPLPKKASRLPALGWLFDPLRLSSLGFFQAIRPRMALRDPQGSRCFGHSIGQQCPQDDPRSLDS